jgi:hypothetical protein
MIEQQTKGIQKSNASSSDNTLAFPSTSMTSTASPFTYNTLALPMKAQATTTSQPMASYRHQSDPPLNVITEFNQIMNQPMNNHAKFSSKLNNNSLASFNSDNNYYSRSEANMLNGNEFHSANIKKNESRLQSIEYNKQQLHGRRNDQYFANSDMNEEEYRPSFYNEPRSKFNKDNIVEKPNSLSSDVPSYGRLNFIEAIY